MAKDLLVSIGELSKQTGVHISSLRRFADSGQIPSIKLASGHRRFDVAAVRQALAQQAPEAKAQQSKRHEFLIEKPSWQKRFLLAGLEEDLVWREIAGDFNLNERTDAELIFQHALTELLNNAIDHSSGSEVEVKVRADKEVLAFEISDDGVGIFAKLKQGFHLAQEIESIAELSKGKRTTDPTKHTGEGIFFTSKAVDLFSLSANGLSWRIDNLLNDFTVEPGLVQKGTTVFCSIARDTQRKLKDVFSVFTEDFDFVRTRPVVKLFETGLSFISRSEAKRLLVGLENFKEVDLDFEKVQAVGQAFVDEVFRVWATEHPNVKIIPVNMNESVEFMVRRGLNRAAELAAD